MTRAEFGLKLLDWWGVNDRATLRCGPSDEQWPKDCRLNIGLAQQVLNTGLSGVDQVLASHQLPAG
jgi:hypothetical protein